MLSYSRSTLLYSSSQYPAQSNNIEASYYAVFSSLLFPVNSTYSPKHPLKLDRWEITLWITLLKRR